VAAALVGGGGGGGGGNDWGGAFPRAAAGAATSPTISTRYSVLTGRAVVSDPPVTAPSSLASRNIGLAECLQSRESRMRLRAGWVRGGEDHGADAPMSPRTTRPCSARAAKHEHAALSPPPRHRRIFRLQPSPGAIRAPVRRERIIEQQHPLSRPAAEVALVRVRQAEVAFEFIVDVEAAKRHRTPAGTEKAQAVRAITRPSG